MLAPQDGSPSTRSRPCYPRGRIHRSTVRGSSCQFLPSWGEVFSSDLSQGGNGHMRAFGWARRSVEQELWVCIGLYPNGPERTFSYEMEATYTGSWPARTHPTAADWTSYDDRVYRELILNDHDNPGTLGSSVSLVRSNSTPHFYIELGGPNGCENGHWRLSVETLHFWRAVVPTLAEMITGIPYTHPVEAGCSPIPAVERNGHGSKLVVVSYVTEAEYRAETGESWGVAGGRATVGGGRIWIHEEYWNPDKHHQSLIAHEVGHAFGLRHTSGPGELMNPSTSSVDFPFLTRAEEDAARRAYEAGYQSRYCGDPRRCGNGKAIGEMPAGVNEPPIVVVDGN